MAWIGGIFSKVNMSRGELREKLALMIESACPTKECSAIGSTHWRSSILDDTHGQALVQVSMPTDGTPSERVPTDCQEKPVLIYDGHFYDLRIVESKLSRVQHRVNKTPAESLVRLLA
ncbi:MAG TPA: hypothetical protein VEG43_05135, partial [Dehalococcoidia bacterium]|nr:hypothetical protein [Dehalococcoidia bacterium]